MARYLTVKEDYLQDLIERKPLTLVQLFFLYTARAQAVFGKFLTGRNIRLARSSLVRR